MVAGVALDPDPVRASSGTTRAKHDDEVYHKRVSPRTRTVDENVERTILAKGIPMEETTRCDDVPEQNHHHP